MPGKMKTLLKILIFIFFLPTIVTAAEITIGLNTAFGMYGANWEEQEHFDSTANLQSGYYHTDPGFFFEPEISFRFNNRWQLITKVTLNKSEQEMDYDGDMSMSYFNSTNDYTKLYSNITLRYFLKKFMYIKTGLDFNYLGQTRQMEEWNQPIAIKFNLKYNLDTILPGTFLGLGFYAQITKGLYFEFITSTLIQYGTIAMDIKDENYKLYGYGHLLPSSKDRSTTAFGQNGSIALGYYFKNAGIDIAITFNSQYLMYIQDNKSDFDNIDGNNDILMYLGIKISYTFSLTGKIRPWAEWNPKGDKIWIPTHNGKSTWL
jgi:hypothetical protein